MDIHLAGSRPTRRAPKEYFTGTVWQDPIIAAEAPARVASNRVSFEPGARTNWHTHPLGQTLYVVSGVGRVQTKGGPIREITARRRGLDSAGRKALAWRLTDQRHDPHRDAGSAGRKFRDLDGAGDRRGIFGARSDNAAIAVAKSAARSEMLKSQQLAPSMMVWLRDNSSSSLKPTTMAWSRLQWMRKPRSDSPNSL